MDQNQIMNQQAHQTRQRHGAVHQRDTHQHAGDAHRARQNAARRSAGCSAPPSPQQERGKLFTCLFKLALFTGFTHIATSIVLAR